MIVDKKALFSLLIGLDLVVNILGWARLNVLGITTILSLGAVLGLPGLLISLILRIRIISFWENLVIIVGLSVAFLEIGGLLFNILLPLIGVRDPLTYQNLSGGFAVSIALLFLLAWLRTKPFVLRVRFARPSWVEKVLYALPASFPILATSGSIVLNNGGSNILTLILLGGIAVYCLLLVLFYKRIPMSVYPVALYLIAVASLFTTSLRGWYITGHDIEIEYYVFKLTNTYHLWNMAFFQSPYNACLSITLLPTILTNLLAIPDIFVYKVVFQLLFALTPVLAFFMLRPYIAPILAFLSAFLFLSFPTFFTDMAMLNRQEIGFLFFGLALYMMLERHQVEQTYERLETESLPAISTAISDQETQPAAALAATGARPPLVLLSLPLRRACFVLFAVGVIISHYSTNFVQLALLTFVSLATFILARSRTRKVLELLTRKLSIRLANTFPHQTFLTFPLLLFLFGGTFFWNTIYTQSSQNATRVLAEVVNSILVPAQAEQSRDLAVSIFNSTSQLTPEQLLQRYIQQIIQEARTRRTTEQSQSADASPFYSPTIVRQYPTYALPQSRLPLTPPGRFFAALHISAFNVNAGLRLSAAYFMQIFVLIGLAALFFSRNKKPFELQLLLLCLGALLLLAFMTVLPTLAVEYGILRVFQQMLFILSLPIVLGLNMVFFFLKEQKRFLFIGISLCLLFLNVTGFVSHLTGDYYPQLTLDNAGVYYAAYYVGKREVAAILWLAENDTDHTPIQADLAGGNQLLAYGNLRAFSQVFPGITRKNAYVYLKISNAVLVSLDRSILAFNSPQPFLDENKNLLYSNGTIDIFK